MDKYLFHVYDKTGDERGFVITCKKSYWEKHKILDDNFDEELDGRMDELGFGEVQESVYECCTGGKTVEEIRKILVEGGLEEDESFRKYASGFFDE